MQTSDLRIALFSGNYNYVRDGANQALNRLVGYLLKQGAKVRVYSPAVENPAFPATGDLVSVPSIAIPNRPEYRIPLRISGAGKTRFGGIRPQYHPYFQPRPRRAASGQMGAKPRNLPVLASVHTRFETYFRYYNMSFVEPLVVAWLRKLYRKCDALGRAFRELCRKCSANSG